MPLGDNSNWDASRNQGYLPDDSRGPVVIRSQSAVDGQAQWWADEADAQPQFSILEYWRVISKHRLVILAAVIIALAIGIAVTLLMRPIYTASATLQIDREAAKVLNTEDAASPDRLINGQEFFQTQYGLLKSRSLASRVVESLNLANNGFLQQMAADVEGRTAAERKAMAVRLVASNLGVEPIRESRLVRITFESPDAALSARITNAIADNFISSNLDRRFESSTYARDFLEQRLKLLKPRLEASERQLVAYAASQQIINVPTGGGSEGSDASSGSQSLTAANLVALNTALAEAKGDRIRAEQRWRQAQSTPGLGLPEALTSPTIQQLTQSRAKLSADYQEKLSVYKPDFPVMQQLKAQIEETDRQIQLEIGHIREGLRAQYNIALAQERSMSGQVEQLKSSFLDLKDRSIQYAILQREVDTNRSQYEALLQRYKDVTVAGGIVSNNISIVDRAEPPGKPTRPNPLLNMGIAAAVGLLMGLLMAVLLEALDESIKSPEDVEAKLGLPLLGSIPTLEKGVTPAQALADIRSPFSEAYYSIRTALQFSTNDGVPKSLLVTSSRPSEGKSTSAAAIAQNFARLGSRVLLVDGDLRNPSLHRNMGVENRVGLSNYLTGSSPLAEVMQPSPDPQLVFIPCGPLPPNPAELLSGPRLRAFLAEAGAQFDLIVVDGPPVMGLADAPMLASVVAGTLLVVEAGATRRGVAKGAIRRLAQGHARLLGVLLTKFNARKAAYGAGYGYGYDYEYGAKPAITTNAS